MKNRNSVQKSIKAEALEDPKNKNTAIYGATLVENKSVKQSAKNDAIID